MNTDHQRFLRDAKALRNTAYSILDLATLCQGQTAAETFHNSLLMARQAESLGFTRYWFAEHHNMANVASSATAVLIGYIAGNTKSMRVGSGGIMLPNHAPLIVAEQFGTLASLYPGRIDLGLGRAPGTDPVTAKAIRGENMHSSYYFPRDVQQLQRFFSKENQQAEVRAIPGEGLSIPIWILGSSTDSAYLAAQMGLPYAFASHFAPGEFMRAISLYRENFQPSEQLQKPYVLACINVVAAQTDAKAAQLATSLQQLLLGVITGKRAPLQAPVENMDEIWSPIEKEAVEKMLLYSFIGSPDKIRGELQGFLSATSVDELMATSHIFDREAKLTSCRLFAELFT